MANMEITEQLRSISPLEEHNKYLQTILVRHWYLTEMRLQHACQQMETLQNQVSQLQQCLRVTLRLGKPVTVTQIQFQLETIQCVYKMYHRFADEKARELQEIWIQLKQSGYTEEQLESIYNMDSLTIFQSSTQQNELNP